MKTRADLKRQCKDFEWSLIENTYMSGEVPSYQHAFRQVKNIYSTNFTLLTEINGEIKESWIDFPKASELEIIPIGMDNYFIKIKNGHDSMVYRLRPRQDSYKQFMELIQPSQHIGV